MLYIRTYEGVLERSRADVGVYSFKSVIFSSKNTNYALGVIEGFQYLFKLRL